ncbi:phosphopantetheinyl transferase [Phlyctema vagabunda]|uniref:holo-[acyl-carrier-protein] synthase n=1 Tax=Phlyctema vagabunda TaxID=108571 RepID=A0ABR4P424_9HELO
MAHEGCETGPTIVQWMLDTRPLWLGSQSKSAKEQMEEFKTIASRALALLPPAERQSVLKYYHVKDAKMGLASHLLKHLVITKHCNIPWSESIISRDENKKPCYIPSADSPDQKYIEFNVSHQAGIVSLIASFGFDSTVQVGTDVVCVDERLTHDYKFIEKEGFFGWVDMHGDVFAPKELDEMKLSPVELSKDILSVQLQGYGKSQISRCQWRNQQLTFQSEYGVDGKPQQIGPINTNDVIDQKLRRFYAFWCLREAYVKMTGEALLAPWLRDLEFRDVQPPNAKEGLSEPESLVEGDALSELRIFFKGKPVQNVDMDLRAYGQHFMLAGALRVTTQGDRSKAILGSWRELDIERDVLEIAEARS